MICYTTIDGRTGLCGRGKLYYWGPNHAADPILIKLDSSNKLYVAVIQRSDNGVWALPVCNMLSVITNTIIIEQLKKRVANNIRCSKLC